MQMPSIFTGYRMSVPPLYRWNKGLRRAIWTSAVIVVASIYLLMTIGLASGLALALGALVK